MGRAFSTNPDKIITYEEWISSGDGRLERTRWKVFAEHGTKCHHCDRVGTLVVFWRETPTRTDQHVDLAAVESNDTLVMMTMDHYWVPKSLGGPKTVENCMPMCEPCNRSKDATIVLGRCSGY